MGGAFGWAFQRNQHSGPPISLFQWAQALGLWLLGAWDNGLGGAIGGAISAAAALRIPARGVAMVGMELPW